MLAAAMYFFEWLANYKLLRLLPDFVTSNLLTVRWLGATLWGLSCIVGIINAGKSDRALMYAGMLAAMPFILLLGVLSVVPA